MPKCFCWGYQLGIQWKRRELNISMRKRDRSPKSPGKYFQPPVLRLLNLLLASCYSLLIYNCKYYLLAAPHASLHAWMASFFDLYCINCFWISRITPFWLWHMPSPPSSLPEVTMAVHIYCRSLRSLRRHYKIFSK